MDLLLSFLPAALMVVGAAVIMIGNSRQRSDRALVVGLSITAVGVVALCVGQWTKVPNGDGWELAGALVTTALLGLYIYLLFVVRRILLSRRT